MDKKLITTPIYYVNDVPHIGHTYTTIAADTITRFYKLAGSDAHLLTGTDEHGAKIAEAAEKHNETPKEYADKIASEFKKSWDSLGITYDRFIRTTDPDHEKTVKEFLQKLYDSGAIEQKPRLYTGLYCVSCEKFWQKEDLKDDTICPDHLKPVVEHSEENYYFGLSKYQAQLIEMIESGKIEVMPETRKNEILGKLKQGLEDISISRKNVPWGITLPFDESHTAYVWIDALINYYTFGSQNDLWPAYLHLVGKDILWFHSVIWPAMLIAADLPTTKRVFAHGFFTIDGQKMSKTLGNVIKPAELVEKYGVDGTRYILLASFSFGEDGDFSWEQFNTIYNSDLANGIGNLSARVAKLAEKSGFVANEHQAKFDQEVHNTLDRLKFNEAINWIRSIIALADQRINQTEPWKLSGTELKEVLDELVSLIQRIAFNLQPFMPETAEKILQQFQGEVKAGSPLFPRITETKS
jgi:methionyl-tRNA synthetase